MRRGIMEGPETLAALDDFDCTLLDVSVKGELGLDTGINHPTNLIDDGLPEEITKEIFALEEEDQEIPFRSRCNTWPRLQNPINLFNTNPSVNDNPDSVDSGVSTESNKLQVTKYEDEKAYSPNSLTGGGGNALPLVNEEDHENDSDLASRSTASASTPPHHAMRPKMSSRRNPWGNMSYADLITQAIQSSQNQRLTLAQIYEWLVKNVTYFQNKGDNVSSLGWKNSIRHNLSLHNKFMRVQNEGAGKSSWWMLNPEETKPLAITKPTRRRANTLDSTSKFSARRGQRTGKRRDSFSGRTPNKDLKQSTSQSSLHPEVQVEFLTTHGSNQSPEYGRPRTSSNASSCGRLSPFRPRTLSNTSSTCDYNSPSQENSCDGIMPLSSWNQASPVAQFQEKLNLNENSNTGTPMEEDEHEHDKQIDGINDGDPLKYIELNDLDLEPLMTKILAAAAEESLAVQNATSQQQQQKQQQQQQLNCPSVQSPTSVTIPSSLPTTDSPANLLNVQPTLSSLTVSSEQLRTTGIVRQPSPQLPPQLCLPQDHIQGQSMGLVDDKAFQELREIQMEQQELVDQTSSTTLAFSQALPNKIKILEQRDLPSDRSILQGNQDRPKPWNHSLRNDDLDHSSLGQSLPNPQTLFETNRFGSTSPDLPPAFIRSTSAETLVSSSQGTNYPPVTNNSFLNTALASQPLSTLSESMDESPYYEEFMKTEISSSDLTEFDFGLASALDSALASETSSSQPNSFHQIML